MTKVELLRSRAIKVSLLTGGGDPTYALPLCSALTAMGVCVDFIAGDGMANADAVKVKNCQYYNLRGSQDTCASIYRKVFRILAYYYKLLKYSVTTDSQLFHILWPTRLWPSRLIYFDRTIVNVWYKMLGKRVVYTAHNINEGERDNNDTVVNRLTLRFLYKYVDHIFVHTDKMKSQLIESFQICDGKVTVIPFGINNVLPESDVTAPEAKSLLNVADHHKTLLFFGIISPYKGLDILIAALSLLRCNKNDWRLIIAGSVKKGQQGYWDNIENAIAQHGLNDIIVRAIEFIPDENVERYFKAADVAILPYRHIFQSGVLVLAYNFGLPVIAADVGALRESIVEGETGFACQPENPEGLAKTIVAYFDSDLYKNLKANRRKIIEYANKQFSWHTVGEITRTVYRNQLDV